MKILVARSGLISSVPIFIVTPKSSVCVIPVFKIISQIFIAQSIH